MRRSQNVSAPAAIIVIVVALIILFAVFNHPAPEAIQPSVQVPEPPPVDERQISDMYKGLSPLGIVAVFPPLLEDRLQGVRVVAVVKDTPAARAGLKPGDFIATFDQKYLVSPDALTYLLARVEPKKTYQMQVTRSGKTMKLPVTGITPLPPEERVKF